MLRIRIRIDYKVLVSCSSVHVCGPVVANLAEHDHEEQENEHED